ncbi:histamine N-methyltransferase-like [Lytechinus variegatus]|uniref:histamine N-methyltransferase-like n=1 Tax=Lytechinus variegatus TaxID=7654 RepID=UPI001BB236D6|nr:histamine N-methyltransferase-like [Lytechinus variegatus]
METQRKNMRTPQMKSLVSDLDYYAEAYRSYAGFYSHKIKLYQKWADDVFLPIAVEKLQEFFQGEQEFRILGIGSGGGEIDVCLLERLSARFSCISNTVVEPATDAISKYKALLDEKATSLPGVTTHLKQTTFEEFCAETRENSNSSDSRPTFHLIHAISSLYHVDDFKKVIREMYEMLEEGGVMLVIVMTDDHVIYRMWDNFPFLVGQQQDALAKNLSSKDITTALEDLGIAYSVQTVNCRTDAISCFNPESEEGGKVLDFLTNTIRFRDTAPAEMYDEVLGFLRAICSEASGADGGAKEELKEGVPKEKDHRDNELRFNRDWRSVIVFR